MKWTDEGFNKQSYRLEKINKVYMEISDSSLQIYLAELGKSKPTILDLFWWDSRDLKSHIQGQLFFQVYCEAIIFRGYSMATQMFYEKTWEKIPSQG